MFTTGRKGTKDPRTISWLIERTVYRHMGFTMTEHQFRHLAAKVLLDENPGAYPLLTQLLGHKNLKTALQFYAGLDTKRAALHHWRLLEAKLARAALPLPRRQPKRAQPSTFKVPRRTARRTGP